LGVLNENFKKAIDDYGRLRRFDYIKICPNEQINRIDGFTQLPIAVEFVFLPIIEEWSEKLETKEVKDSKGNKKKVKSWTLKITARIDVYQVTESGLRKYDSVSDYAPDMFDTISLMVSDAVDSVSDSVSQAVEVVTSAIDTAMTGKGSIRLESAEKRAFRRQSARLSEMLIKKLMVEIKKID